MGMKGKVKAVSEATGFGIRIVFLVLILFAVLVSYLGTRFKLESELSKTLEVKRSLHSISLDLSRMEDDLVLARGSRQDNAEQARTISRIQSAIVRSEATLQRAAPLAIEVAPLVKPFKQVHEEYRQISWELNKLLAQKAPAERELKVCGAGLQRLLVYVENTRDTCFEHIATTRSTLSAAVYTFLALLLAWFAFTILVWVRPTLKSLRNALESVKIKESVLLARESELRAYRQVLDHHSIVATTDIRGRILTANDKFVELSGYPIEELIGSDHRLLNSGQHSRTFWSDLYRTIHRGEIWTGTIRNRAKDGTHYWVNTSIGSKVNAEGEIDGFIAVRTDVTAEKVSESLISEAYHRIERITDHIPGAVFQCRQHQDGSYATVFASPQVQQILGISPEALVNDFSLWTQSITENKKSSRHWVARAFEEPKMDAEFDFEHPELGIRRLTVSTSLETTVDGEKAVFGFLSDVTDRHRIEEQVKSLGERFALVQETMDVGIWDWDVLTNRLDWDGEMFRIFGVDPDTFSHRYEDWAACCMAGESDRILRVLSEALASGADIHDVFRIKHPILGERHITIDAVVVRDGEGNAERVVGLNFDVTEKVLTQQSLDETEERYRLALAGTNDGVWDWDLEKGSVLYSARWREVMGLSHLDEIGKPDTWLERTHPEDAPKLVKEIGVCLTGEADLLDIEHRILHGNGFYRWVHVRGICLRADGQAKRFVGSISDIHSRKLAEEALRHAATTDRLTGLPNRDSLYKTIDSLIDRNQSKDTMPFALMFLDFDRFKVINDSLGHEVGDGFLIGVAQRLRDLVAGLAVQKGSKHVVARLAGDEFVILVDSCNQAQALELSELVLEVLSAPLEVQGNTLYATASIGVVTDTQLDLSKGTEGALADADLAMYKAKSNGKNRVALFDEQLRSEVQHRLELEQELRRALYFGEFSMKYQPIMSLADSSIASFEALIRWKSPTRGFVSPADFIPIAEDSGLIVGIGDWVMEEVCRQILEWNAILPETQFSVSINVSRKQLMLPLFAERVEHLVRGMGIQPDLIHLEVTESALMANTDTATKTLQQLRQAGFHIDLDDFGTGYTSLADLDNFPLDVIKIDKSFVDDIAAGGRSMEVIRAVRTLGDAIGAKIIAEGVETEEQLRMLYYMGIDMVQGYLISKPLDPGDAIVFEYDLGAKLRSVA